MQELLTEQFWSKNRPRPPPLFQPQQDEPSVLQAYLAPPLPRQPPQPPIILPVQSSFLDDIIKGVLRKPGGGLLVLGNVPKFPGIQVKSFIIPDMPGLNSDDIDEFISSISPFIEWLRQQSDIYRELFFFINIIIELQHQLYNKLKYDTTIDIIKTQILNKKDQIKRELNILDKIDPRLTIMLGNYLNTINRTLTKSNQNFWYPRVMSASMHKSDDDFNIFIDEFMDYNNVFWRLRNAEPAIKYMANKDGNNRKRNRDMQYQLILTVLDSLRQYLDEYKNEANTSNDKDSLAEIIQNNVESIRQFFFQNYNDIQKEMNTLQQANKKMFDLINTNFGKIINDKRITGTGIKKTAKPVKLTKSNLSIKKLDKEIFKILNS